MSSCQEIERAITWSLHIVCCLARGINIEYRGTFLNRTHSMYHSNVLKGLASSAPSPESTILTPMALIFRAIRNMGVLARIVVTSYVSTMRTTWPSTTTKVQQSGHKASHEMRIGMLQTKRRVLHTQRYDTHEAALYNRNGLWQTKRHVRQVCR